MWVLTESHRLQRRCTLDALTASLFGLGGLELEQVLRDSAQPRSAVTNREFVGRLDPKGFWRVDKDKDPELRHTVLTLIAFHDLEAKIREHGGDRDAGIAAFLAQNHGEGWMLPETLRLADYGLGHDDRAREHQPVASRLGPRFYDWQLTQTAEESWRECHLHARNLLGDAGYQQLLADIAAERNGTKPATVTAPPAASKAAKGAARDSRQQDLF
jgi:hypothetical protein